MYPKPIPTYPPLIRGTADVLWVQVPYPAWDRRLRETDQVIFRYWIGSPQVPPNNTYIRCPFVSCPETAQKLLKVILRLAKRLPIIEQLHGTWSTLPTVDFLMTGYRPVHPFKCNIPGQVHPICMYLWGVGSVGSVGSVGGRAMWAKQSG